MALSRLVASLLLLSLLAIASANTSYNNYGHTQNEKVIDQSNPTQPESNDVHKYGHQSEQVNEHNMFPSQGNVEPAKYFDGQKPKSDYQSYDGINYIEIRGTILCKSGTSSYTEISGAIAKITCPGWNENGYEYAPFSMSSVADKHGIYYAKFPLSELPKNDWSQLLKACKVFPEYSPLGICNLPLMNGGSNGEYVSYSRIAGDKAYYNAGSLFYTAAESSRDYPKESTVPKDQSPKVNGGY